MNMAVVHQQHYDRYPSRAACKAEIVERKDPAIYSVDGSVAPIPHRFIEQYQERGFMLLENVFSQQEVTHFKRELDRLRNDGAIKASEETITESGSGEVRSIFKIHEASPVFKQLSCDSRLIELAQFLLNDEVYIHQSRLNYKPGFRGKEFYWHSDFETWHVEDGMPSMRALSMSITLTENDETNGPLMLIPGSHQKYVVCEGDTPEEHFKASLKKQEYGVPSDILLNELVENGGIFTAKGKPGSVVVFDCNTMHGSNGNISPRPRSNAFIVYNAMSNRVVQPFGNQPPRPEYICTRQEIKPVSAKG